MIGDSGPDSRKYRLRSTPQLFNDLRVVFSDCAQTQADRARSTLRTICGDRGFGRAASVQPLAHGVQEPSGLLRSAA